MTLAPRTLAIIDAVLYLFSTLAFALFWHVEAFEPLYTSLQWPTPEQPGIALGFLAVLTQGLVLGFAFQSWLNETAFERSAASFCAIACVFLWSSHVIGDAAKCGFLPRGPFIAIETIYLIVQFVMFWVILVVVHRVFDARIETVTSPDTGTK